MLVLGIETATHSGGACLLTEEILVGSISFTTKELYSQRLLPSVEWLMARVGADVGEIDAIAVSIGPGSFTGLRIGLSVAKALAYAGGAKVLAVPTMEALALRASKSAGDFGGRVCTLLDARQKQVYAGKYEVNNDIVNTLNEEYAGSLEDIFSWITEPTVFAGDAVLKHRDLLKSSLGDKFIEADRLFRLPHSEEIAELGLRRLIAGESDDLVSLEPHYVRRSYF